MKSTPLISILMTAYNREKYIAEAIQSVLATTYQNWELIIVDDCSTDNTLQIAKQTANRDNRIRIITNDKNLGQFKNRNKAADLAKGDFLKYLDSDDVIYPHGLEVMINSLLQFPESGIGICQSRPDFKYPYPLIVSPENAIIDHFSGTGIFNAGPSSCIIRKNAFFSVGGFTETDYVGNDTQFFLKIAEKFPVVKMTNGLIWWRRHLEQAFSKGASTNSYFFQEFNIQAKFLLDSDVHIRGDIRKKLKKSYTKMRIGQLIKKCFQEGAPIIAALGLIHSWKTMYNLIYSKHD